MKDFVVSSVDDKKQQAVAPEKPRFNNFVGKNRSKSRPSTSNKRPATGHTRSPGNRTKEVTPITRSLSPNSKIKKKSEEFLKRIEKLQTDLEVQGNQFKLIEGDLIDHKQMMVGNQNRRETAS